MIWFGELKYVAHSDPDGHSCDDPAATWQPLAAHLRQVACLAEGFARDVGASEALISRARALGLLHDVGKYTQAFQRRLRGEAARAPHSDFGRRWRVFSEGLQMSLSQSRDITVGFRIARAWRSGCPKCVRRLPLCLRLLFATVPS